MIRKTELPMTFILITATLMASAGANPVLEDIYVKAGLTNEVLLEVPFRYQEKEYYCGPAALQMVFEYYGENISQSEIADVARTIGEPLYSTFTDELRRAAHFSNLSTSAGDEEPGSFVGYTSRQLGYAAFESNEMDLGSLKEAICQGKPLILLMWYSAQHSLTHYRVALGYNETHIFLHDPWNKPIWGGKFGGPSLAINNTEFLDLWSYWNNWALYVSPWILNLSAPTYFSPNIPFQVNLSITYPLAPPNAIALYPTSTCTASILLTENITLVEGESRKKSIGKGFIESGTNSTVYWMLITNTSLNTTIGITVEGTISGSVGAHGDYTAYNYTDRIGSTQNFTHLLNEDSDSPEIGAHSRVPDGTVEPDQETRISVNATDLLSGVKSVRLSYTSNRSLVWYDFPMIYNPTTSLYETTIPGHPANTLIRYKVKAIDNAGNNKTDDNTEQYYIYLVIPEFPSATVLPVFALTVMLVVIVYKRKCT